LRLLKTGISTATVSSVPNNSPLVSAKTKEMVLKIMGESTEASDENNKEWKPHGCE